MTEQQPLGGSDPQYQNAPMELAHQQVQMHGAAMMAAPFQFPTQLLSLTPNSGVHMFLPHSIAGDSGAYFTGPEMFTTPMPASQMAQANGTQQMQPSNYTTVMQSYSTGQPLTNVYNGNYIQQQGASSGFVHTQQQQQHLQGQPHSQQEQAAPQQPQFAPSMMSAPSNSNGQLQGVASACTTAQQNGSQNESWTDVDMAHSENDELTPAQKAKQSRERNKEHARTTRLRKKAYVQKLKELVDGLHAQRAEEEKVRRAAIRNLTDIQDVRRAVIRSFLASHSTYECDPGKWANLVEDDFWFKQPVTPYRSFRRAEIEQDCRMSRGIEAMISDAASVSVMVESIGSRCTRWMEIKRDEVQHQNEMYLGSSHAPQVITGHKDHMNHAVSSLSSNSGSSNGEEGQRHVRKHQAKQLTTFGHISMRHGRGGAAAMNVESSTYSSQIEIGANSNPSNEYHDYNAKPLPDPKLGSRGETSLADKSAPQSNNSNGTDGRKGSADSLSSDNDSKSTHQRAAKHMKINDDRKHDLMAQDVTRAPTVNFDAVRGTTRCRLPANIAKHGGISHNIRSLVVPQQVNSNARLNTAPAITLPPFMGIGKRAGIPNLFGSAADVVHQGSMITNQAEGHSVSEMSQYSTEVVTAAPTTVSPYTSSTSDGGVSNVLVNDSVTGTAIIVPGDVTSTSGSLLHLPQIRAWYHINEDDMLVTDDVIKCPFIFRSQDAIKCGAINECFMPGMLRAQFSTGNKLMSLEMVYDALGFMQQLERASGSEGTAKIIPGSLEMALCPHANEARVITLAKAPFLIVSVNEAWSRLTKYTQMEVEGQQLSILHGKKTNPGASVRVNKPMHKFQEVALGRCACSTNVHYDKEGIEFIAFVCSYPLTNAHNDVTHILHVSHELPAPTEPGLQQDYGCLIEWNHKLS